MIKIITLSSPLSPPQASNYYYQDDPSFPRPTSPTSPPSTSPPPSLPPPSPSPSSSSSPSSPSCCDNQAAGTICVYDYVDEKHISVFQPHHVAIRLLVRIYIDTCIFLDVLSHVNVWLKSISPLPSNLTPLEPFFFLLMKGD